MYWRDMMKSQEPSKACLAKSLPSASGHGENLAASGHVKAAARRKAHARDWKPAINGGQCYYEAYRGPRGNLYEHWIVRCHRYETARKNRCVGLFYATLW